MTQEISQIITILVIAFIGFFFGYICGKENSLGKSTILDNDSVFKDKQVKSNHLSFKEKIINIIK